MSKLIKPFHLFQMADDDKIAADLKEEGNNAYKEGNWDRAIDKYTEVQCINNQLYHIYEM